MNVLEVAGGTKVDSRAPGKVDRTRSVRFACLPTTAISLQPHWWIETSVLQAASDP